jgi:hypothetical protein
MPYKGAINAGSDVVVTFTCFPTNRGSALVLAGCATTDGESTGKGGVAAPGGFTTLNLTCSQPGLFKVDVDMSDDSDSGTLEVKVKGVTLDQGRILGDTVWSYSVI